MELLFQSASNIASSLLHIEIVMLLLKLMRHPDGNEISNMQFETYPLN